MDNDVSNTCVDHWSKRMIALIADNLEAIRTLCRKHGVRNLDLFGSAATGSFNPASSDLDFVVDLGEYTPGTADRYLDLITDLEELLGTPVEMVTAPSITNPYFRQTVNEQRMKVYETRDRPEAA